MNFRLDEKPAQPDADEIKTLIGAMVRMNLEYIHPKIITKEDSARYYCIEINNYLYHIRAELQALENYQSRLMARVTELNNKPAGE